MGVDENYKRIIAMGDDIFSSCVKKRQLSNETNLFVFEFFSRCTFLDFLEGGLTEILAPVTMTIAELVANTTSILIFS